MKAKGVMRGLSQLKPCSRKKTLKNCNMKGKLENVVLIDVDGDRCENVIIIDAPEFVEEDLQDSSGSKGSKRFSSPSVICIDDDETDNMASIKSFPAPEFMRKSAGLDDDGHGFIREKKSAFKLSRCKKTYSGKTPCGKRFGLSPESEDGSSGSDCSDCEFMEGSVGKLREQWEKAFQRKRYNVGNGQSGLKDWTSAPGSCNDTPPGVEEEDRTQPHAETPASSGSGDSNIKKQNSSAFETNSDNYLGGTCLNRWTERPFVESDKKVDHEGFSQSKYGPSAEAWFSHVQADVIFGRERFMKDSFARDGNQECSWTTSNCDPYLHDLQHGKTVPYGKEKLQSREPLMTIPKFSEEKQVDDVTSPSDVKVGTVFDESTSVKTPLGGMPVVSSKNYCDREKVVSGDSSQNGETQIKQSFSEAEKRNINSVSNIKKYEERLHVQGVDATVSGKKDIIIDREKFKETDEYKQAVEEEWESRQQELKIQAEEAQRLRKRRKAESMHLLDMERRQKQRLEEMRETQKKDEESMNLKEHLRFEVRKELSKLEISCIDMASLLRNLGIPVGGGFCPLSSEIRAAYKQALLRFHPDRASKTDIRQRVEAEEKFKLVSRMKEKFLVTSCH